MTGSLNIDVVTETYAPEVNGVAMTLGKLVEGLQALGHRVRVFRPRQSAADLATRNGTFAEHLLPGMRVPLYPDMRMGFPAGARLRDAWRKTRPDVIYVATEGPLGWSAVNAARHDGIPVVSGFHTNFHTYSKHYFLGFMEPLILNYLRKLHTRSACTLAPTERLAGRLRDDGFGRVDILSRGVDTTLFNPARRSSALRARWGAGEQDIVCLYVGRIAAEKNIATAVNAVLAARREQPGLRFVLVGDGPLREKLAAQQTGFVFTGVRRGEELAQHYASGDIFLFPSRTETFGNVVTEAMASGLAVVAYNEAAAGEHIRDGNTGCLVDPRRGPDFGSVTRELCRHPARVEAIGERAAAYARDLAWPRVVETFARLLGEHVRGYKV